MAAKWLTAALLASTLFIAPAKAALNDAAHFSGGSCIYNGGIINNLQPGDQGAVFGWYQNIGTANTQTVVESGQGKDIKVEFFRKSNGVMQLHLYVAGLYNGTNSQYINAYSSIPLVTAPNTPAYFLAYWESTSGTVVLDMNGTISGQDTNSFTTGLPFLTLVNGLPWTVGCSISPSGIPSQFLSGDLNQLWLDQGDDHFDILSHPRIAGQGFVVRQIPGPPAFLPMPLGYQGTAIFGLLHGAPIIFLQGSGGDGLFNKNFWGSFAPLTSNPGTTFNFPWHLSP